MIMINDKYLLKVNKVNPEINMEFIHEFLQLFYYSRDFCESIEEN